MITDLESVVRLMLAVLLGGIIGYERQARHKSAGLRTHILVCIGSCLIMILSINIYYSVQGHTNADPTRLAAQVVSGIGFLGAGTIMKEGLTVRGLTTAASLWVVSGVGLAAGSGYYLSAFVTTVMAFLTLTLMSRLEKPSRCIIGLVIETIDQPGQIGKISMCLGNFGANIQDIKIDEHETERMSVLFLIKMPEGLDVESVFCSIKNIDGVLSVKQEN